jgi:hypothetical protein
MCDGSSSSIIRWTRGHCSSAVGTGNAFSDAGQMLLCGFRPRALTRFEKGRLNNGLGKIAPGWPCSRRSNEEAWIVGVVGRLVFRPRVTIANEQRGDAVRGEIAEFMDTVRVSLPTSQFSRHAALYSHTSRRTLRPLPHIAQCRSDTESAIRNTRWRSTHHVFQLDQPGKGVPTDTLVRCYPARKEAVSLPQVGLLRR